MGTHRTPRAWEKWRRSITSTLQASTRAGKVSRRNKSKNHGVQNAQKHSLGSKRNTNKLSVPSSWRNKKSSTSALNLPREIPTTTPPNTPILAPLLFPFPEKRRKPFPIFQVTKHSSPVGEHDWPINALYKTPYLRLHPGQSPHPQTKTPAT